MHSTFSLAVCFPLAATSHALLVQKRDASPSLTRDPSSSTHCTWWLDYSIEKSCQSVLEDNLITIEQFKKWNPSVGDNCAGIQLGHSYCVEAAFEPLAKSPATPSNDKSLPLKPPAEKLPAEKLPAEKPSTTKPSNGIETPQPVQPGMVENCNKFHFVKRGDTCLGIAAQHGIDVGKLQAWNPGAGNQCTGLWAETYCCVSVVGHQAPPTKPSNGIQTPQPIQPGMVENCNKFYLVKPGDTCLGIAAQHGVDVSQIQAWNPSAGKQCTSLWAETHCCVSVVGHQASPTRPSNGIQTPQPIQPGMVTNCNKFYFVKSGDTCVSIASRHGISATQLQTWNPAAGRQCTSLWAETYCCVATLG